VDIFSSGEHEKLEITACSVDAAGNVTIDEDDKISVMLNPNSYKRKQSICFSDEKSIGEIGNRKRFCRMDDDSVSIEVVIDGTGVVTHDASITVDGEIEKLKSIVGYSGSDHQPKHSRLVWGTLVFFGRMKTMDVNHTLFKPSGEPLRASVLLVFVKFMTDKEESIGANRSSPDLSHIVHVREGDTLPLLCHRIYSDCRYYMQVARINSIDNFRVLNIGDKLLFPPLK